MSTLSWYERFACRVLRMGPIPTHIAFIMDGNRRYARSHGSQPVDGHQSGYIQLLSTLQWCLALGIQVVTVYAFSIDNFKRPKEEVDGLMELAAEKFNEMSQRKDVLIQHEIRVRFWGNTQLLPDNVAQAMRALIQTTKHHNKLTLNICMSYTSQHEISESAVNMISGVSSGVLSCDDITIESMHRSLSSEDLPLPQLLVRTSGETRLSDFLLWQVAPYAHLSFLKPYWPDMTLWHFAQAILDYQRAHIHITKRTDEWHTNMRHEQELQDRRDAIRSIILSAPQHKKAMITQSGCVGGCDNAECECHTLLSESAIQHAMEQIVKNRNQRVRKFLEGLR